MYQVDRQILRWYCESHSIPLISTATEDFLYTYICTHQPQHIIEIWAAVGYSSLIVSDALQTYSHDGTITSREVSFPHYYQAVQNTRHQHHITIMLGNFCEYPYSRYLTPKKYDMIFIDWRKSETLQYIQKLLPYIHNTTTIIIDDSIKFKSKMQDCYDLLDNQNIPYTTYQLDSDDGVLIIPQVQPLLIALYDW